MRPIRQWLPAFIVLFIAYQAPQGVGIISHQPAIATALMLAFLPIAWFVARTMGLRFTTAYALEWNSVAAACLAMGLLSFGAKAAAVGIGLKLGIYTTLDHSENVASFASMALTLAWLALSTFVPSIAEDIVTRGFWARVPHISWTAMRFVLFSSTLYVLNHIYRLGNGPTEWLMLFCFGLAYATAFWRSGSLWAAVGLHWGWNFAGAAIDLGWPTDVLLVGPARLLSAATHLTILLIVVLVGPRKSDRTSLPKAEEATQ